MAIASLTCCFYGPAFTDEPGVAAMFPDDPSEGDDSAALGHNMLLLQHGLRLRRPGGESVPAELLHKTPSVERSEALRGSTRQHLFRVAARSAEHTANFTWRVWYLRVIAQFVFGSLYFRLIVANYPLLTKDASHTREAIALQSKGEIYAACDANWATCFQAFCCSGPRAAHTFHSAGVMSYWPGLCCMIFMPCLTLFFASFLTDLSEKLGGRRRGCCMSALCSCCCSCCVITKDAESLDMITGTRTGLCGIIAAAPGTAL